MARTRAAAPSPSTRRGPGPKGDTAAAAAAATADAAAAAAATADAATNRRCRRLGCGARNQREAHAPRSNDLGVWVLCPGAVGIALDLDSICFGEAMSLRMRVHDREPIGGALRRF